MLSGSQVTSPSYVSTPTTGVANTDVIGAQSLATNAQIAAANANSANNQGLYGLLGSGLQAGAYFFK